MYTAGQVQTKEQIKSGEIQKLVDHKSLWCSVHTRLGSVLGDDVSVRGPSSTFDIGVVRLYGPLHK
jgi:hypothetical protein